MQVESAMREVGDSEERRGKRELGRGKRGSHKCTWTHGLGSTVSGRSVSHSTCTMNFTRASANVVSSLWGLSVVRVYQDKARWLTLFPCAWYALEMHAASACMLHS